MSQVGSFMFMFTFVFTFVSVVCARQTFPGPPNTVSECALLLRASRDSKSWTVCLPDELRSMMMMTVPMRSRQDGDGRSLAFWGDLGNMSTPPRRRLPSSLIRMRKPCHSYRVHSRHARMMRRTCVSEARMRVVCHRSCRCYGRRHRRCRGGHGGRTREDTQMLRRIVFSHRSRT